MYKIFHFFYKLLGHILCRLFLVYWHLRDWISPPKTDAVLFVAHPDDDTLFFHTFIKEQKPYVVLLTTGWSLRRMPCFFKAMKWYGVRYRAYDLETRDTRIDLLAKYVQEVFSIKEFNTIVTHNATGEYGHEMHKRVHNAVTTFVEKKVLCPVPNTEISKYPVSDNIVLEKECLFNNIYTTEKFVLTQYRDWVVNEQLEEV